MPGAAETWSVSADGRTWTFRLRAGLRWSDGTPLSAAQFVAGLDAARAQETQAPYAELLREITAARATDARTVVLELARAVPYLPAVLALPVAAPLNHAANAAEPPVGNGPYRLLLRSPGEKVELERNPEYHAAGSVAIDRVTYLTLEDLNTELNLYRSGALDITSEVPNTQVDWLQQNLPGELHVAPFLSTYGYAVNLARVRDRDARMALAMAIDRQQIVTQVTGAGETAATGWVPPGIPGYYASAFRLERPASGRALTAGARAVDCRSQTRCRAGAADAVHGREFQPSPDRSRARRPMAAGAGHRRGHRRDGMEGVPGHARAAR